VQFFQSSQMRRAGRFPVFDRISAERPNNHLCIQLSPACVVIAVSEDPSVDVDRSLAQAGAEVLAARSKAAAIEMMRTIGVVSEDGGICMGRYTKAFVQTSYVVMGKLWSRQRMNRFCTCKWYCLYAHCEHLSWACGKEWPGFPATRDHTSVAGQKRRGRPPNPGSHAPDASNKRIRASRAAISHAFDTA
jgi:hypothetical protein